MTTASNSDKYVTSIELDRAAGEFRINGEEFPWFLAADRPAEVEVPNGADSIERHLVLRIPFFTDDCTVAGLDGDEGAAK